ncbi:putative transcription factor B3-Domain family [Helianthus anomalus]
MYMDCYYNISITLLLFALSGDSFRRCVQIVGMDKAPTNVLIQTEDGRTFNVCLSEAKGKLFFFHGWSNVIIHLRLTKGCLVIFNPVDCTTFNLTYFLDGVSRSFFWTYLVSTTSHFIVIPECILPKCYDYTTNDLISIIYIGNKTFHIKIETVDGKVGFTNCIDVTVSQLKLKADYYLLFTKCFGNYFHLRIFGKNGVEKNFVDVDVEEAVVAPIDSVHDVSPISVAAPAITEQPHGRRCRFGRMAATYFSLSDTVSRMAKLDFGLKPITVRLLHRSPQKEFINGTRREKKDNGFRYALTSSSSFMKSTHQKE